jgi:hypothetical protein
MPMTDYWRYWSTIKKSPHMIVDFSDIGAERFVDTMTGICDFFALKRTKPITWSGVANTECDNFLVGYAREFPIMDRKFRLQFTRWRGHWSEPGQVPLGTLHSSVLDKLMGVGTPLYVHTNADGLLTHDQIAREREAFSKILGDAEMRDMLAAVIVEDHALVTEMVNRELAALQDLLIAKFSLSYRKSVEDFLRVHPDLQQKWSSVSLPRAA